MTMNGMTYEQTITQNTASICTTSMDGTLIWKITNVKEKIADAQSERQTCTYSPCFRTSLYGYKMRVRLYLCGEGNAKTTHASLFLVLMSQKYDAILQWPFPYRVGFCLYDQSDTRRHIIDSFRPGISRESVSRTQSDMDPASGISKFVPLSLICEEGNPYVRDDTMFIKVLVDFHGLSRSVLRYAFGLNPAFPVHIRQSLIQTAHENEQQRAASRQDYYDEEHRLAQASLIPLDEYAPGMRRPQGSVSGTKFHGISPRDSDSEVEE